MLEGQVRIIHEGSTWKRLACETGITHLGWSSFFLPFLENCLGFPELSRTEGNFANRPIISESINSQSISIFQKI